jgi:16S rRNA (adenine1518-N6/adenine1519-N6)-dimethyltransferase
MSISGSPGKFIPRKKLGQHFLIDKNILAKIIAASSIEPADTVLEIGPGKGCLTDPIVSLAHKTYAVEIDRVLYQRLKERFLGVTNLYLINADILKLDLNQVLGSNRNIKVIANIPYYISSPIIEYLFRYRGLIDSIYLTVQKEFASRVTSGPGSKNYGSFSLFVRYYAEPEALFNISKNCFKPAPKVDSTFLCLKLRRKPLFDLKNEAALFKIIRAAFGKRRKTLRNSLKGALSDEQLNHFFIESKKDRNVRPEQLSLKDFVELEKIRGETV